MKPPAIRQNQHEQQAEASCLPHRAWPRQPKLDAAVAKNLEELGYGG